MNRLDIFDKQKFIFGGLLLLSNKLQVVFDRVLSIYELTTRQWLLTLAIAQFGDNSPSMNEIAKLIDNSHQNIGQLAKKLEFKGFLYIEKDRHDLRSVRLKLTEKNYLFWKKAETEVKYILIELFTELSQEDINSMCDSIKKLYEKFKDIKKCEV
jgi:DNA-binding MarR family transcriptional regulator